MRRRTTAAALAVSLGLLAPAAAAYPRPGTTQRVSVAHHGGDPNAESYGSISVSRDGRFVAFPSSASNLIGDDPLDYFYGVYVRDTALETTELVAKPAQEPSISADGRYVAFQSTAALLPADTNDTSDVYVRDRVGGALELVSATESGSAAGESFDASVSGDGSFVAFTSGAANLPRTAPAGLGEIYVRDRVRQMTTLVSVPLLGRAADDTSFGASISADGSRVAFISWSSTLVPGDNNTRSDAFVRDLTTGSTRRISIGRDGVEANEASYSVALSGDGRVVAFETHATNLVPQDANGFQEIYAHDLEAGVTERVSVSPSGEEGNHASIFPTISHDGRYISFQGGASNLVPNDTNGPIADIFVRDRRTSHTELIGVRPDGNASSFISFWSAISGDGRHVAFANRGNDLVSGDGSRAHFDMYSRDRGPASGVGHLVATPGPSGVDASGWATFSGAAVASGSDDPDEVVLADSVGADLTGAQVTVRPEAEDVHIGIDVSRLPAVRRGQPGEIGATSLAGLPGVVYSASFSSGEVPFEVRALRAGLTATPSAVPLFALYRCDVTPCREVERVRGSIGTMGHRVEVSVPLAPLAGDATLEALTIRTGIGEAATGVLVPLDEIVLGDTILPEPVLTLGLAPAGTPEQDVDYSIPAVVAEGRFARSIAADPGTYDLWARACLGAECGSLSKEVVVP